MRSYSFRSPRRSAGRWSRRGSRTSPGTVTPATRSPTCNSKAAETEVAISTDGPRPLLNVGTDPQSVRQRVETMERLLERLVVIPGINQPIGLDVILDLVPVVGDIAAAALGAYIVWEAKNLGMSKWQISRMAGNVGIDWLLGLIPFVGAVPDFFFRSNSRNLRIIKRHLDKHHAGTATIEGQVTKRQ